MNVAISGPEFGLNFRISAFLPRSRLPVPPTHLKTAADPPAFLRREIRLLFPNPTPEPAPTSPWPQPDRGEFLPAPSWFLPRRSFRWCCLQVDDLPHGPSMLHPLQYSKALLPVQKTPLHPVLLQPLHRRQWPFPPILSRAMPVAAKSAGDACRRQSPRKGSPEWSGRPQSAPQTAFPPNSAARTCNYKDGSPG